VAESGRWAAKLGRWLVKLERWLAKLGRWVAKSGRTNPSFGTFITKTFQNCKKTYQKSGGL
jgi:hypothetical protein